MTEEHRPNNDPMLPLLQGLAADLLADSAASREYLDFVKGAQTNEAPFRLTKTQRWVAIGGCVVALSWGINALIQSDDRAEPIGTATTPAVEQSSKAPGNPNGTTGRPLSGKGGAPNYNSLGDS